MQTPRLITTHECIGTVSHPPRTSVCAVLNKSNDKLATKENTTTCKQCNQSFSARSQLFQHLYKNKHFIPCPIPVPLEVYSKVEMMADHLPNRPDRDKLLNILRKHAQLFDNTTHTTIKTTVKHTIDLVEGARPQQAKLHRKSPADNNTIDQQTNELLQKHIARPSNSPWAAPVVLVKKKDGTPRFCIDYRLLNMHTKKDSYPLPNIRDMFDHLNGAKYYSKLDLKSGYHQIPIAEEDKPKTAFRTSRGLFEFNVMPQGIKNGPPTFQRIIDNTLGQLRWDCCMAYIDDIIVYSETFDDHIKHLDQVCSALSKANFRLNTDKCDICKKGIKFLGHQITDDGILPLEEKVSAIRKIPTPKNAKAAVSFVKAAEYYRNHIKGFSELAASLHKFAKYGRNHKFKWGAKEEEDFQKIKDALTSCQVLHCPQPHLPFRIQTDASNIGIGGVLMQVHPDGNRTIAYMSKTLKPSERKWTTTERECLAIVEAIKLWDPYIAGTEFQVYTDHHSLCWLTKQSQNNPRLDRWRLALQHYMFTIHYLPGKSNCMPDCLSRFPQDDIEMVNIATQTENIIGCVGVVTRSMAKANAQNQQVISTNDQPGPINGQAMIATPLLLDQNQHDPKISTNSNTILVFDNEQLKQYQQEDSAIRRIFKNIDKPSYSRSYSINVAGLVCKLKKRGNLAAQPVPVLPKSRIQDVLLVYHNSAYNGAHLGVDRTYNKIRTRYYWPNMYKDIQRHIQRCTNCTINKCRRKKPDGHLQPIQAPHGVWEKISIDFVGDIKPQSQTGNKYIVVAIDLFSKFAIAKPTRDNTAMTAAKFVVEDIILKYGAPIEIISDNGTHFTAQLFQDVVKLCGVCHIRSTPYHPQTNGNVERLNATLKDTIAALSNAKRTDWDQQVSKVIAAYNSTTHATTKITPFELMHGRPCRLLFDLSEPLTSVVQPQEYLHKLHQYLVQAKQMVRDNIQHQQHQMKMRYDQNRRNPKYNIGDWVYIWNRGINQKFSPKYIGPYQIIRNNGNLTYQIQHPHTSTISPAHVSWMRPL
ncbi:unnamed protein product [Didymodactylos carnosus]|uniref:Reverse transcriptase n=1 Tax=Didymodactylos carnosus TaxID=1234261 RepID=A0A814X7F7_9BILA|nr:unnamed protein product [Didymodactylos carnosus]CAF1346714.1 unnamed protein product [Didymodactylos carnosus]CAF3975123.1 unnamed protein product [Didymodactylos carnosus]CAF4157622.1 unnamed protein product [Didymodactylos carnosus]